MEFLEKDKIQIQQRGSQVSTIINQIRHFENGFPYMKVAKAATINDGLLKLDNEITQYYIDVFEAKANKKKLLKFVPASGAASRMFKSLFAAKDDGKFDTSVDAFFNGIGQFAFYSKLTKSQDKVEVLKSLLDKSGLDYGAMPKGLLDFHKYASETRTAIEEHLVEGALYANNKGKVRLHFTVSPEHKSKFKALINKVKAQYELKFNVKYNIVFSEQMPSTDTIAVDDANEPFRDNSGKILFRPAGHGALLKNLDDLDADIIFIKNIDNVVPDHIKAETIKYKKALAGLILDYQTKIFGFLRQLNKPNPSEFMIRKANKFLKEKLFIDQPKGFRALSVHQKLSFAITKLNRPLRACGMVKNIGEPGGGPFWVKADDETLSLQVVESAQFDMENKKQKAIFETATHFNPVDLICATKNYKKEKFELSSFSDPNTGFITEKSQNGKILKAQELPGLWNGSMANWNTIFVEVPLITFNPVKTVNDLLRKEHQGK